MQWELVVALLIAIPVILFPAAYVWYLNLGGIYAAVKEARERRAARKKKAKPKEKILQGQDYDDALAEALKRYRWHWL